VNAASPGTFLPKHQMQAFRNGACSGQTADDWNAGHATAFANQIVGSLFLCAVWQQMSPDALRRLRRLFV
jgi:hypothetical protein